MDKKINYTILQTPKFEKLLLRLSRKYENIAEDIEPYIMELAETGSTTNSDRIPGVHMPQCLVYKIRTPNSSASCGTRGGFRIIYYFVADESKEIYLLSIYSKNDRENITPEEIKDAMEYFLKDR